MVWTATNADTCFRKEAFFRSNSSVVIFGVLVDAFLLTKPILIIKQWAQDFDSTTCPPFSRSKVGFFAIIIPIAAAMMTTDPTGVPAVRSTHTYCWTSLSKSPSVSGLPRYLLGMLFTIADCPDCRTCSFKTS